MSYLTPTILREKAPAAQKLPKSEDALVDTSAFLRHIGQDGYRPVYAAQGKAHADVDAPEKGRHFIVAATADGEAYAILNSHTVYRRAWLAAGYCSGDGVFLLGAVVPLPRWRGFSGPLQELGAYKDDLKKARNALTAWNPDAHGYRWLAKRIASTAYLQGHKPASAKSLTIDGGLNGFASLRETMERLLRGGLEPTPRKGFPMPRKVKPIRGPDALMQASNAVFRAGLLALVKYHQTETALNFPAYKRT
jgi:hypothetical protein